LILLDANILLYAWNSADPRHQEAKQWVEGLFLSEEWIGIPWPTAWAFLRVSTNARVFPRPLSAREALEIVGGWMELPNVAFVQPQTRHAEILRSLVISAQATGPLLSDAVLAALAIEQGATLASTDHDFSRFPGLAWTNPLAAS
jgi:hypothetical protein